MITDQAVAGAGNGVSWALSPDRLTLTIRRRLPGGTQTCTLYRDPAAGPFTGEAVTAALAGTPRPRQWQPGQRNTTRRTVTRSGILWTRVMTGPPTWWLPKARREKDGTFVAGWLRLAVAARLDRKGRA